MAMKFENGLWVLKGHGRIWVHVRKWRYWREARPQSGDDETRPLKGKFTDYLTGLESSTNG
jgi:hypothetical protein